MDHKIITDRQLTQEEWVESQTQEGREVAQEVISNCTEKLRPVIDFIKQLSEQPQDSKASLPSLYTFDNIRSMIRKDIMDVFVDLNIAKGKDSGLNTPYNSAYMQRLEEGELQLKQTVVELMNQMVSLQKEAKRFQLPKKGFFKKAESFNTFHDLPTFKQLNTLCVQIGRLNGIADNLAADQKRRFYLRSSELVEA